MSRSYAILGAVTLSFFFLNLSTFASLGVVLYDMLAQLHWSQTEAGFSFTVLGLACGLSSPLPAALMRRIGARWTMVSGGVVLACGFALAAVSHSLLSFYLAMLFLGVGYSLAGNVPGIFVTASWFPNKAPKMIGIYLMVGALGNAVGPPLAHTIVSGSGSWRADWAVMAVAAAIIGVVSLLLIREPLSATTELPRSGGVGRQPWHFWSAVLTPQFVWIAISMTLTMACITTVNSVAVTHLTRLGETPGRAAMILGVTALVATLSKGVAGGLCSRIPVRTLLTVGVLLQAVGMVAFAMADNVGLRVTYALAFGMGWGVAYLAASVLMLEYFGRDVGSQALSAVWLVTTLAAAGPLAAGAIADRFATFAPVFYVFAGLLAICALPIAIMQAPKRAALTRVAVTAALAE